MVLLEHQDKEYKDLILFTCINVLKIFSWSSLRIILRNIHPNIRQHLL